MLGLDRLERLHLAVAVPAAVAVVLGFALLDIEDDESRRRVMSIVGFALTGIGAIWWLVAAGRGWLMWIRTRTDTGQVTPIEPADRIPGRALALLTGIILGGFAGLYEDPEPFGAHLGAFCVYFVLLPMALLACVPRVPAWRPFADIALMMLGAEFGSQLAMSYAKWGELHWWDDISGFNFGYAQGAFLIAIVWFAATYRVRRREALRGDGTEPPPRKA